jgi:NitT/TauT family transport system permease protein
MADLNPATPRAQRPASELGAGTKNALWATASGALAIATWALLIVAFHPATYILPAPWDVIQRTWTDRSLLAFHGLTTMSEILVGLGFSTAVGIPLGIAIVAVPMMRKMIYPLIVAFNSIPKVALAPLFVVWLGYGMLPRVLITASIAFFPILVSTVSGLMSIDPDFLRLAKVMRAHETRVFLHMRLPCALPAIFSGIKVATSFSVIGGIVGEFIASDSGWGYLLLQASGTLDTTIMFSVVIILGILASAMFNLVGVVEKLVVPWHASQRSQ